MASFFVAYTYDDRGNRIEKICFNGPDTAAPRMSSVKYSYDEQTGKLLKEALFEGDDTVSTIVHSYDARGNEVCIVVFDANGCERYRDSLSYGKSGNLSGKARFADGKLLFCRSLIYDTVGRKTADSLYEPSGGALVATQVTTFSYDNSGSVLSEKHYRLVEGTWYCTRTTLLSYKEGVLAAVTVRDGEGGSGPLIDSTAFFFDGNGNKIREQRYDDEGELLLIVDYTWELFMPVVEQPRLRQQTVQFVFRHGELRLTNAAKATVAIFDMGGRKIRQRVISDAASNTLIVRPEAMCPGRYVATVATGRETEAISFTVAGK